MGGSVEPDSGRKQRLAARALSIAWRQSGCWAGESLAGLLSCSASTSASNSLVLWQQDMLTTSVVTLDVGSGLQTSFKGSRFRLGLGGIFPGPVSVSDRSIVHQTSQD